MMLLALAIPLFAQEEQQPTGAKELFAGGSDASVVQAAPSPHATTPKPLQRPLGLSYWIELIDAPGGPGSRVTDRRTFKSGEKIRLHFRGNTDGRIAILQVGSSGTATQLFPDAAKGMDDDAIRANSDQVLPSPKHWFRFDEVPGTERLLVLFAKKRSELERVFPKKQMMDVAETMALLQSTERVTGSKDLVAEADEETVYVVNKAGQPLSLEIKLTHQ